MTDSRRNTERDGSDSGSPPRMPRWVKVAAIAVGVLVLIFFILQLTGIAGQHGPGRHALGGVLTLAGLARQRTLGFAGPA